MPKSEPGIAAAIKQRMDYLRRTLPEVLERTDIGREQWRRLRRGDVATQPQMKTRRAVAHGLDWPIDAIDRIRAGEDLTAYTPESVTSTQIYTWIDPGPLSSAVDGLPMVA